MNLSYLGRKVGGQHAPLVVQARALHSLQQLEQIVGGAAQPIRTGRRVRFHHVVHGGRNIRLLRSAGSNVLASVMCSRTKGFGFINELVEMFVSMFGRNKTHILYFRGDDNLRAIKTPLIAFTRSTASDLRPGDIGDTLENRLRQQIIRTILL